MTTDCSCVTCELKGNIFVFLQKLKYHNGHVLFVTMHKKRFTFIWDIKNLNEQHECVVNRDIILGDEQQCLNFILPCLENIDRRKHYDGSLSQKFIVIVERPTLFTSGGCHLGIRSWGQYSHENYMPNPKMRKGLHKRH